MEKNVMKIKMIKFCTLLFSSQIVFFFVLQLSFESIWHLERIRCLIWMVSMHLFRSTSFILFFNFIWIHSKFEFVNYLTR